MLGCVMRVGCRRNVALIGFLSNCVFLGLGTCLICFRLSLYWNCRVMLVPHRFLALLLVRVGVSCVWLRLLYFLRALVPIFSLCLSAACCFAQVDRLHLDQCALGSDSQTTATTAASNHPAAAEAVEHRTSDRTAATAAKQTTAASKQQQLAANCQPL